ncbi:hypothetical protein [Terrisporobacter sp.]
MKLSNKEKILLATLGGLLVGGAYYQFVFSEQTQEIHALQQNKAQLESKYNEVMESASSLESNQQEVKDLLSQINFKTRKFYPRIIQEKIILDLNEYLKESYLNADISFSEISVKSVEKLEASKVDISESTFQDLVDEYNGTITKSNLNSTKTIEETNSQTIDSTNSSETTETTESKSTSENTNATVEMLKATINYKGTYKSLKKFISQIEVSNRQLLITDLSATSENNGEISGTMSLEYYSIPKLNSRDSDYLKWEMKGKYGKKMPFLIQKPKVVENDIESTRSISDFAVMVKSINSNLPSVIIGKSTDTTQSTYITNKKNSKQKAKIEFTKVNGKYYCKYKLDSNKLSKDYHKNGISFIPSAENIIIDVSSEKRNGIDDKAGLDLNVINKTDKIVEVKITNDDSDARVAVTRDSQNIKVTRR